jgi:chorismate mutase
MPDPTTNDIDALLRMLNQDGWENYHAALTALVAERDKLSSQVCGLRIAMKAQDERDEATAWRPIETAPLPPSEKEGGAMSDNTNDIDALLAQLMKARDDDGWFITGDQAKDFSRALTGLVAERDALAKRVAELEADLRLMMMPFQPSTASMIAEAQLRMTCSALTGIYANPNISGTPKANGENAAAAANAALAAMRKGGGA